MLKMLDLGENLWFFGFLKVRRVLRVRIRSEFDAEFDGDIRFDKFLVCLGVKWGLEFDGGGVVGE